MYEKGMFRLFFFLTSLSYSLNDENDINNYKREYCSVEYY